MRRQAILPALGRSQIISLSMIDLASPWRVCWDGPQISQFPTRSPHAAPDRLLFFASIPVGLYRAQIVPGSRKYVRSQSESQAGGAGRPVFGDRRPAVDETPSGPAAL